MPPTDRARDLAAGYAVAEHINAHRLHSVPNPYASPEAACEAWMRGSLWGNPIYLAGQVQVYGCWIRNWSRVYVWFRRDMIVVVKPPADAGEHAGDGIG